ncbi:MAG: sigma 54-interacting transcriptional regulator [Kofleriaceae bacterium]
MLLLRGFELVRAVPGAARVEGEVLRYRLRDPEGELAVVARERRSDVELEILDQLVGQFLGVAADGASTLTPLSVLRRASPTNEVLRRLIVRSPMMQTLYAMVERAAGADSTSVLIQGENGTGKELVAHAIHQGSSRRDLRFVVANCSAFNDNLVDSELFGHVRGAFTGASSDKVGLFEAADHGTFFLDEIGDMSRALQAKVLRVLQDGTFLRVGDHEPRKVDVRIIAATNRNLEVMVRAGEFREDLYYRINAITLEVPPLRARVEDIPPLIDVFLRRRGARDGIQLAPDCLARMLAYGWPGNVRELQNEIERLVVLAGDAPIIDAGMLSPRIRDAAPRVQVHRPESLPAAVEALEREMIAAALERHRGNKSRAAQELHVSRRNLIRLVQKYRLDPDPEAPEA